MMRRLGLALLATLFAACIAFATTVLTVPVPSTLPITYEREAPLPLRGQISGITHRVGHLLGLKSRGQHSGVQRPLTVGFYPSWADDSAASLARNVDKLDWVAPTLLSLDRGGRLATSADPRLARVLASAPRRPLLMPVLQNANDGAWTSTGTVALLADPARRAALITGLQRYLDQTGGGGIVFDLENLPPESLPNFRKLLAATRAAFAPQHRLVAVTMPIDSPDWKPREFAPAADRLILMAYDEHWQGGQAGPIASSGWFADRLARAVSGLPQGKAIVALGSYAYDWHDGKADSLTVEEAWLAAHDSAATPQFLPAAGGSGFAYEDNGHRHDVWMLDAASSWNQFRMLSRIGATDIALWRLGSEDPGFWNALDSWRRGSRPDLSKIAQQSNVDVEGQGEILKVAAVPQAGLRDVTFDRADGTIRTETYRRLPTPYAVERTGARERMVALTFDDGPDPVWTPRILSILERYHAPASFFIVGENGVENRDLLRRIVADGSEIGNHSYTHPNMAEEAGAGIGLELNATQRLIEAATGRATRLFRAPYFGDAEPTTADELGPALEAQRRGYAVIGLHVDPDDWKRPGAEAIAQRTLAQVRAASPERSANIVLLHDGGGDRAQTVAALPAIIEGLRAEGYQLVTVGQLAGLRPDQVMPPVSGMDLAAVRTDVAFFAGLATVLTALNWTFFFAIALGVARSLVMAVLAVTAPRQKAPPSLRPGQEPLVTVIIPAFNEERVIEASVRRVLASSYGALQVIVADDGSSDRTSPIVAAAFAGDPRVTLLTLVNGGKAAALNRALKIAQGEIIVALDADTQFEADTIARLVRWFVSPRIGAVAGNAKVGNRVNLVTRWQAVEYVTAQNLERRALARFDAIMVVPGAVGAWRRSALDAVGGYPEDTLAEDQDLTIAIQRRGWKVIHDEDAVAWTEAPETLRALGRQRFRWSFGTLQCLWKHRRVLRKGRPGGLALVGMPQAWLFQILFAMVSPAIDLALLISTVATVVRVMQHGWAQTQTDVLRMGAYWLVFTAIDLACGWIAYLTDRRERRFPALLLLSQRIVYRQLMYGVVVRAVGSALAGLGIGWGKLERTGRVNADEGGQDQDQDRERLPIVHPAATAVTAGAEHKGDVDREVVPHAVQESQA